MCKVLGIPSPKVISAVKVNVFYVDKDIDRIVTYCEKDTIAVAQIFLGLEEKIYWSMMIIHV
jgi:hypothetical protein